MLGSVDVELTEKIKKSLISDDISLIKVISYCTSRGTVAIKIVEKTRDVNRQTIGEFIDVDEAYRRIKTFVATSKFGLLPEDDQMNAIAFIPVSYTHLKRFIVRIVMFKIIHEPEIGWTGKAGT